MIIIEVWTQWDCEPFPHKTRTYAVDSIEQLLVNDLWYHIRDEPHLVTACVYEKVDDQPYRDRRVGTITRTSFVRF